MLLCQSLLDFSVTSNITITRSVPNAIIGSCTKKWLNTTCGNIPLLKG